MQQWDCTVLSSHSGIPACILIKGHRLDNPWWASGWFHFSEAVCGLATARRGEWASCAVICSAATLSLHWVRALQCNLRQISQRSLLCKFISVSNSSPTLEAPFSLCLQNNPYMKKDGSIGIGPTISESKVIGTCNFPEEMKYLK